MDTRITQTFKYLFILNIILINCIFASRVLSDVISIKNTYFVYAPGADKSNPKERLGDLSVISKDLYNDNEKLSLAFTQPFSYLTALDEDGFAGVINQITDFTINKYKVKQIKTISFDSGCVNSLQKRYDNYMKDQLGNMPGMVEIMNPQLQNASLLFFKEDKFVSKIMNQIRNSIEGVKNVYLILDEIHYNKSYLGLEWNRLFDQKEHGHYMTKIPHLTVYVQYE